MNPRQKTDLDLNLLKNLETIEHSFRLKKSDATIADIIAKYYKRCNGSKNGKTMAKTDADSKKVMNLCVAYKFLLHNQLVQTCFENTKKTFANAEETK